MSAVYNNYVDVIKYIGENIRDDESDESEESDDEGTRNTKNIFLSPLLKIQIMKLVDNTFMDMALLVLNIVKREWTLYKVSNLLTPIFNIDDPDKAIDIVHILYENKLLSSNTLYSQIKLLPSDILIRRLFDRYPELFTKKLTDLFISNCKPSASTNFIMGLVSESSSIEKLLRSIPDADALCIITNYYEYYKSKDANWKFADKTINYLINHDYSADIIKYAYERSLRYMDGEDSSSEEND